MAIDEETLKKDLSDRIKDLKGNMGFSNLLGKTENLSGGMSEETLLSFMRIYTQSIKAMGIYEVLNANTSTEDLEEDMELIRNIVNKYGIVINTMYLKGMNHGREMV